MDQPDIMENYPVIDRAADDVLGMLCTEFRDADGVHVETIISIVASLAGLAILRGRIFDFSPYKPGMVLPYDPGRETEEIRHFMEAAAEKTGLDPSGGWEGEIPGMHRPALSVAEMTRGRERKFTALCERHDLRRSAFPYVAVLAALKFVYASDRIRLLDQKTGKALIVYYLAAGATTVPYPAFA